MLRTAQTLRLLSREAPDRADAARDVAHLNEHVRLVVFDKQVRGQHGQDAALALEGGDLHVLIGRADDAAIEAARVFEHGARDPLGTDAGLPEAAPGEVAALGPPLGDALHPRRLLGHLRRARRGHPAALPVEV